MVLELEGLSPDEQTNLVREAASLLAQNLVQKFPLEPQAHILQGNTFRQLGQSNQALACWQRALTLAPQRSDVFTYMAVLAEEKGQLNEALGYWQKVIALEPTRAGVRDSLAHTLMGLNRYQEAKQTLEEELALSPRSPRTHYILGKIHLQQKQYPDAVPYYERALALDPNYPQACYELGTALIRSGRRREAKPYLQRFKAQARKRKENDLYGFTAQTDLLKAKRMLSDLATDAAALYQSVGRSGIGLDLLRQAVILDPNNVEKRKRLAARYRAAGHFSEALMQCERIALIEPNDPTCHMLIGSLSLQLKRYDRAKSAFSRMIDLAPRQAYGYRELARLSLKTNKNMQQAVTWARRAVSLEASANHYYILSLVCHRNGDIESAREAIQQALRLEPGNQTYRKTQLQMGLGH